MSPLEAVLSAPGEAAVFTAVARGADGAEVPGAAIRWSTTDPSVATVDGGGVATAVGPGEVAVLAEVEGVQGLGFLAVDPDTLPPTLVSVAVDPRRVGVLNRPGLVTLSATLRDARSGVGTALGSFRGPGGSSITGVVTLQAVQNRVGATHEGPLTVPANSTPGLWTLSLLRAEDKAGNVSIWREDDLAALGFRVQFDVVWTN